MHWYIRMILVILEGEWLWEILASQPSTLGFFSRLMKRLRSASRWLRKTGKPWWALVPRKPTIRRRKEKLSDEVVWGREKGHKGSTVGMLMGCQVCVDRSLPRTTLSCRGKEAAHKPSYSLGSESHSVREGDVRFPWDLRRCNQKSAGTSKGLAGGQGQGSCPAAEVCAVRSPWAHPIPNTLLPSNSSIPNMVLWSSSSFLSFFSLNGDIALVIHELNLSWCEFW